MVEPNILVLVACEINSLDLNKAVRTGMLIMITLAYLVFEAVFCFWCVAAVCTVKLERLSLVLFEVSFDTDEFGIGVSLAIVFEPDMMIRIGSDEISTRHSQSCFCWEGDRLT
jgi:hypothetical protein